MRYIKKTYSYILSFVKSVSEDNVGMYAAQASFFVSISSIPFVMLLLSLLKYFVPIDMYEMENIISGYVPAKILPLVNTVFEEIFNNSADISVISVTAISTLWLSSGGFMALYLGLNKVYDINRKRNYFYRRIVSVFYTLCFLALIVLSFAVFTYSSRIQHILQGIFPVTAEILSVFFKARVLIFIAFLSVIFASFYKFVPYRKISFVKQLPGAVFAALGWCVFTYAYSIYIEHFSNYSYVYGSLSAVVFWLLWLYFCIGIFLYGAELNKLIWRKN